SHYLKIALDAIFGAKSFLTQIAWKRTSAHSDARRKPGNILDYILVYAKTDQYFWQPPTGKYDEKYLKRFRRVDPDGRRWTDRPLTAKGLRGGGYEYEYRGCKSLWRVPLARMRELDEQGLLYITSRGGIRLKHYLDEETGPELQNLWDDIPPINSQARERLGYPTQKPIKLLERIIEAASRPGDIVLDPFCGCGTTIIAAQQLGRRWIGIDITHLAVAMNKWRLADRFGSEARYRVIGEPRDLASARQLALENRYQFQYWAVSLIKARPLGASAGEKQGKKGADRGIDGTLDFFDDLSGTPKRAIVQVKSGKVKPSDVRDLRGVLEREGAVIGVFITLEPPSAQMSTEAAQAGTYYSQGWNKHYPRIQILSVEELLNGKTPSLPP
ncbi:MAG: DNA methyltransferase, partial [Aggregatilineales bacterium]